jgi:hypothetical protein
MCYHPRTRNTIPRSSSGEIVGPRWEGGHGFQAPGRKHRVLRPWSRADICSTGPKNHGATRRFSPNTCGTFQNRSLHCCLGTSAEKELAPGGWYDGIDVSEPILQLGVCYRNRSSQAAKQPSSQAAKQPSTPYFVKA